MEQNERPEVRRVFISYSRVDRARVAKLVDAIRAPGLEIWWDAAIDPGSVFHDRIARELDLADVVVVVWSRDSVSSEWVRDEAEVGRQRNRLLPVIFDSVAPPLGFRQLQSIDLTKWRPGKADLALSELIRAIAVRADAAPAAAPPGGRLTGGWWRAWPTGVAIAVTVTVLALLLGWRTSDSVTPHKPIVAVLPFEQLSDGADAAYFAKGLAEEILDTLGADARFKVLGRTTSQVIGEQQRVEPDFARSRLGVTQLVEGSVRGGSPTDDKRVKVSVRLIDTKDGAELWSQSFDRHGTDIIAIQEEIARTVAARIGGPLAGKAPASAATKIPAEAYEKTLVARQLIRHRQASDLSRARDLASAAIASSPDYAPPYAARALATALLTRYAEQSASALADARVDAEAAVRLDPGLSDGYDALSVTMWLQGQLEPALRASRRAIELRPRNAEAHLHLAAFYNEIGEPRQAVREFGVASALDPLWLVPVASAIEANGSMDRAEAIAVLASGFRTLSVDRSAIDLIDAYADAFRGDFGSALNRIDALLARDPRFTIASQLRERVRVALFAADRGSPPANANGWPTAYDPSETRAYVYGQLASGREAALAQSFVARFGSVTAYRAQMQGRLDIATTVALAVAYDRLGNSSEARLLRTLARGQIMQVEAAGVDPAENAVSMAGIALADHERVAALQLLNVNLTRRWWAICRGPWPIATLPTFLTVRHDPQFAGIFEQCRRKIDGQRRRAGLPPTANEYGRR